MLAQQSTAVVITDPLVDSLVATYDAYRASLDENTDNKDIQGYRIQIFFDSGNYSGQRAEETKAEFEEEFEDVPAYISWRAPNYRVRVGDFRTRQDAEKALQKISRDYPNAWVIQCKINFPKLNKYQDYDEENSGRY